MVLVQGNFLGPWSWNDVTEVLASAQVPAKTIRLPSSTTDGPRGDLYADATQVRAVLDSLHGPVVLCGHSYGGAVMSFETGYGPESWLDSMGTANYQRVPRADVRESDRMKLDKPQGTR